MNTSKLEKVKKLEKQAKEKNKKLLDVCFMDYSPDAGNKAYEWFRLHLEKGFSPDQIVVLIDGMDCGKNLYSFDHNAFKAAEKIKQETGNVPNICFEGD